MKSIVIIIFSFFIISNSFGQIEFTNENASKEQYPKIARTIDSIYKLDKTFDFEFRFWTDQSLVSFTTLFILTQKKHVWSARFFQYSDYPRLEVTETKVDQSKLDNLWSRLVSNQVLTLPPQDSLRNRMKLYSADTAYALDGEESVGIVTITDGISYGFELATPTKKRSYNYHCPQGYLRHFQNIEELYRAFVLVLLIRKYLGLNLVCC